MPHGHLIKDFMVPDRSVQHQAEVNPKLISKTFRLEPKNHQDALPQGYDYSISAKEFLERQRDAVRRLKENRIKIQSMTSRMSSTSIFAKQELPVADPGLDIKTSKLLNVIEHDRYEDLQKKIEETDYQSRMRIKKKDWFISPDESLNSRRVMGLKKSLGYSQSILKQRLIQYQTHQKGALSSEEEDTPSPRLKHDN